MRQWGAPQAEIERVRTEHEAEVAAMWDAATYRDGIWRSAAGQVLEYHVLPNNHLAHQLFLALSSQWELPGGFGGRCTVPYGDIEAAMRMMGIARSKWPDTFARLRVLIGSAREVLIERANAKASKS